MSAVPKEALRLARMRQEDLDEVVELENSVYTHPWTRGNFTDSLHSQYECWVLRGVCGLVGYFVLSAAAGEAHLLNLSVASPHQRCGHGSALLREALELARAHAARALLLEVRPGNFAARALYERFEFRQVGLRRGYYPAAGGREDALVFKLAL